MLKNFSKFNESEQASFFKQAGILLESGIPLSRVFSILKERYPRQIIQDIENELLKGQTFSFAISKMKTKKWIINLIDLGEKTGNLGEYLIKASEAIEKNEEFKRKLVQALIYPAFIFTCSVASLILLLVFVLPVFADMFRDNNFSLPIITRILISLPNFSLFYMLGGLIIAWLIFKGFVDDSFRHNIPFISNIHANSQAAKFSRIIGEQLSVSIPYLLAFEAAEYALDSKYQNSLKQISLKIKNGEALSNSLIEFPKLFPASLIQMVKVGEETGRLGEMLMRAADFFELEAQAITKKYLLFIEPVSTLFVGLIVGLVAFAVILPLFSMVNSLL